MKDNDTPVSTPFSLSQSLSTHGRLSRHGYFDNLHSDVNQQHSGLSEYALAFTSSSSTLGCAHHIPIDSVPNEILSIILETAYFADDRTDDGLRTVMAQASRRWRDITLNTSSLWSVYHLTQGNIQQRFNFLRLHLERSRGYPLDIHLSCFWSGEMTHVVMDHLVPHSKRWQHLSITTPNTTIFSLLQDVPVPMLESVNLCHFSSERKLSLDHPILGGGFPKLLRLFLRNISLEKINIPVRNLSTLEIRGYGTWPEYSELYRMIAGSETLQHLVIHVKPSLALQDIARGDRPPISLPALQTFTVYTSEWLTPGIADLIRTFVCPNLQTLLVQEGSGQPVTDGRDIVRYSAFPKPSLVVWYADMYTAWRCLPQGLSQSVVTLDLRRAGWYQYNGLKEMFRNLASLENMIITEMNPSDVLRDVGSTNSGPIFLHALRNLQVEIIPDVWPRTRSDLAPFLRLFKLPYLSTLSLKNLALVDWTLLVSCFTEHAEDYHSLTSLTLANITDVVGHDCNAPAAFPHLHNLTLLNVGSNPFLTQFLKETPDGAASWPELHTLTICGDVNANKPLLHRVITARERIGKPFTKLFLDSTFHSNADSWDWIKERVDVTEMLH